MRVAVISDIHGNGLAFEAVLADLSVERIEHGVCLGDAIQGGAQPAAVVARLRELAWPVVMGNADAWLLTGVETGDQGPPSAYQLAVRDWSLAQLSANDRAFIAPFRPTVELALPGGTTLLCAHGSPKSFDDIILPEMEDADVLGILGPTEGAIVCGGHTHTQQYRPLGERFWFNPGSIGLPFRRDSIDDPPRVGRWAEYAVLTVEWDGRTRLEFRRAPYDVGRLIQTIRASGIPEPERLVERYRAA